MIPVQLILPEGTMLAGVRHPSENWLMVDQPLATRQRFLLDGVERVVTTVLGIPPSTTAVQFLPDFDRPECAPCGASACPPSADVCLSRDGCPLRHLAEPV
jgi:hypothetical protein